MAQSQGGWYQASDGGWYQTAVPPAEGWVLGNDAIWRSPYQSQTVADGGPVTPAPTGFEAAAWPGAAAHGANGGRSSGANVLLGLLGAAAVILGVVVALVLMIMPTSAICGSPLSIYASAGSSSANLFDGLCVQQANPRLLLAVITGGFSFIFGVALIVIAFGGNQVQKVKHAASAGSSPRG